MIASLNCPSKKLDILSLSSLQSAHINQFCPLDYDSGSATVSCPVRAVLVACTSTEMRGDEKHPAARPGRSRRQTPDAGRRTRTATNQSTSPHGKNPEGPTQRVGGP